MNPLETEFLTAKTIQGEAGNLPLRNNTIPWQLALTAADFRRSV